MMTPHPVYPHVRIIGHVDYDRLEYLRQRARRQEAQAAFPLRPKPIREPKQLHLATVYSDRGESWRGQREAAAALEVSFNAVSVAIKRHGTCRGRRLAYSPFAEGRAA